MTEELSFIRIMDFKLIPRKLFEQVRDMDVKVENIEKHGNLIARSPFTLLYAITDKSNIIRGVLWANINFMSDSIGVHLLSVEKEYQNGKHVQAALDHLKKEVKSLKLDITKIKCATTRPRAFEAAGFEKSKYILMEI